MRDSNGKVDPAHAMKASWGSRSIAPLILTSELNTLSGQHHVAPSPPPQLLPWGSYLWHALNIRRGWLKSWFDVLRKVCSPTRIQTLDSPALSLALKEKEVQKFITDLLVIQI